MSGTLVRVQASDGHELDAYEVYPPGARGAVVVVQEIFGVNPHICSMVDRFAALGYRALAPALFDRVERGVSLDYDAAGVERGRELAGSIKWGPAMTDLAAAVGHVAATGPVGVVGYCFGGSLAWRAAAELEVSAAVGYYGGQVFELIDLAPRRPVMLHFGERDHAIPLDQVAAVSARYPQAPVHVYPDAGHGFNCDARGSYDPVSAAIAWGRTVQFLVDGGVRP